MNYFSSQQKQKSWPKNKKGTSWNQSGKGKSKRKKTKKIKKSLQYLLLLKKFKNVIDYKNIKLLKAFLNKYGKIRPRRKTRIPIQKQHQIARAIRKSRALKLIPFVCDVKL